jgi:serine/threonine-protein kinase
MKREDEENTDLFNVPQAETAQIHDVPKKRITIAGFQAPLPPDSEGGEGPATIAESSYETWATGMTGAPAPPPTDLGLGSSAHRYTLGPILGRGGMGEVFSALDEQIGRPVAIKRLRMNEPSPDALTRFLREARIQGRLEHPAIVPVHELWKDDLGRPFFVMKQLTGVTLGDVLSRLAVGSPDAQKQFSRQRLLRMFTDVCLAIEFAHTRGVVHRDLKPANIVLGDFGEVYVLDWGVARVMNEEERPSFTDVGTVAEQPAYNETVAGSILGTPGYIAPEQIRGESDLDGRADVYALGTILFEILTLYPLHPRGQAAIASALAGVDARPSRRAIDRVVPPELDAICVRATAVEKTDRFPTARALSEAVQEFLDGDRDFVLRRELARTELATARAALAAGNGQKERRIAIRAAARALAFDPTSPQPADLLGRLMLEPPKEAPVEVEQELEQADFESLKKSARFGTLAALAYLSFFPILFFIGFREPWYHIVGPLLCAFIVAVELGVAPKNPYLSGYLAIAANLAMIALLSRVVSPFLIGAGPATVIVMLLANHKRLINTWLLSGLCVTATLLPWFLELVGALSARAFVEGDAFILRTGAGGLNEMGALVGLVLYIVVLIALATVLSRIQDNERRGVRRNLAIQAWQLKELIPRQESSAT